MPPVTNEPDELLDQVLEDERATALQQFREREEIATDAVELADNYRSVRVSFPIDPAQSA